MSNLFSRAIVVVDVQADFTELYQGTLAVPGTGEAYLTKVIKATKDYADKGYPIICTQDYHPPDHVSFYTNHAGTRPFDKISLGEIEQTLWPPHCIQETAGAQLLVPDEIIYTRILKGVRSNFDSYSGFRDDGGLDTDLQAVLEGLGAKELVIYGLATDYCVRHTVLDGLHRGFKVRLRTDLCRGVSVESTEKAIKEMTHAGAIIET